jgi:hypothetical protein
VCISTTQYKNPTSNHIKALFTLLGVSKLSVFVGCPVTKPSGLDLVDSTKPDERVLPSWEMEDTSFQATKLIYWHSPPIMRCATRFSMPWNLCRGKN